MRENPERPSPTRFELPPTFLRGPGKNPHGPAVFDRSWGNYPSNDASKASRSAQMKFLIALITLVLVAAGLFFAVFAVSPTEDGGSDATVVPCSISHPKASPATPCLLSNCAKT